MIQYRVSPGQFSGFIVERSKNGGRSWHPIGDWYADKNEAQESVDRLNELELATAEKGDKP